MKIFNSLIKYYHFNFNLFIFIFFKKNFKYHFFNIFFKKNYPYKRTSFFCKFYKKKFFFFLKVLYFLKTHKNINNKNRSLVYDYIFKNNPLKKIFFLKKYFKFKINTKNQKQFFKTNGVNSKRSYFYLNIQLKYNFFLKNLFFYQNIEFKNIFTIFLNRFGSLIFYPTPYGLKKNVKYYNKYIYLLFWQNIELGIFIQINNFNKFCYYYACYNNFNKYAFSCGTFIKVLFNNFYLNYFWVLLPSRQVYIFQKDTYIFIGRNSNIFYKYILYGGFFNKKVKNNKKNLVVRGVARNPVDHPNGGSTKVKKPFKTPWGKIAKNSK